MPWCSGISPISTSVLWRSGPQDSAAGAEDVTELGVYDQLPLSLLTICEELVPAMRSAFDGERRWPEGHRELTLLALPERGRVADRVVVLLW